MPSSASVSVSASARGSPRLGGRVNVNVNRNENENENENGSIDVAPLAGCRFCLDARAERLGLGRTIRSLGGAVEPFLERTATHLVADEPACGRPGRTGAPDAHDARDAEGPAPGVGEAASAPRPVLPFRIGRSGAGHRSRTDAMLESAYAPPRSRQLSAPQQARLWNIPVWSVKKTERFLNRVTRAIRDKVGANVRRLGGSFVKFESSDGRNRAVHKEFDEWPALNLSKDRTASPFAREEPRDRRGDRRAEVRTVADENSQTRGRAGDPASRMTRKTGPRPKDRTDDPPKRSGYCEICRTAYSALSEHERTASHLGFVKNCSNFLSLDALINEGADLDAFLKMNKSNIANNLCERRSLRNIIKVHQESETKSGLQKLCNGDANCKSAALRDSKGANETGHYLRSKGINAVENDGPRRSSQGDPKRERPGDGCVAPRAHSDERRPAKFNGKIEEPDDDGRGPPSKKSRTIRWRKPGPDVSSPPVENRAYYKVVGMSAKLRSSNSFVSAPQKEESNLALSARIHCNGDADAGLVVKLRKVRRSELSILSDEAENFMFPKRDDGDSTDDEAETNRKTRGAPGEVPPPSNAKIKEEVLSGDDFSQDSCGSDSNRRRPSKRQMDLQPKENLDSKNENTKRKRCSLSKSPEMVIKVKSDTSNDVKIIASPVKEDAPPSMDKPLKWENGKLKTSPEIESLSFTFENVPSHEPWYDTYKRQDEGQENSHNIAEYLGYYWKSPILPYEMGQLPPLKPNCCSLSQIKKPEVKSSPTRCYGTRGMKKKKTKIENVINMSRKPRKSPREHASTLAILGSLVHKRRSKLSSSDDTKSLPSITEEDTSNDVPAMFKLPEIQVSESSKKLEEFFSSILDNDEYDTLVDNLDNNIHFDKTTEKPNVIELLESYDQCEIIENTVKEMQSNMRIGDKRRRKGYKFKKKNNRTGWPAKKKNKRETTSTAGSAGSSREASINREGAAEIGESSHMVLEETHICVGDGPNQTKDNVNEKNKSQNVKSSLVSVGNNENSITSLSDTDDKLSNSVKCKLVSENECNNSEDESLSVSLNANVKSWDGSGDRTISEKDKPVNHSRQNSKDLQPVVRVQKIDTKVPTSGAGGRRKLRSSGPKRKVRSHLKR